MAGAARGGGGETSPCRGPFCLVTKQTRRLDPRRGRKPPGTHSKETPRTKCGLGLGPSPWPGGGGRGSPGTTAPASRPHPRVPGCGRRAWQPPPPARPHLKWLKRSLSESNRRRRFSSEPCSRYHCCSFWNWGSRVRAAMAGLEGTRTGTRAEEEEALAARREQGAGARGGLYGAGARSGPTPEPRPRPRPRPRPAPRYPGRVPAKRPCPRPLIWGLSSSLPTACATASLASARKWLWRGVGRARGSLEPRSWRLQRATHCATALPVHWSASFIHSTKLYSSNTFHVTGSVPGAVDTYVPNKQVQQMMCVRCW